MKNDKLYHLVHPSRYELLLLHYITLHYILFFPRRTSIGLDCVLALGFSSQEGEFNPHLPESIIEYFYLKILARNNHIQALFILFLI